MPATAKPDQLLLRFRHEDNANGVSRKTLARLAKTLGFTETQTLHLALRKLAREVLPAYEPDDGDLTPETIAAIKARVPQGDMKSIRSKLF